MTTVTAVTGAEVVTAAAAAPTRGAGGLAQESTCPAVADAHVWSRRPRHFRFRRE
ncbi:hypothetical protein [Mycobacterium canetti]|uniref:hypothetical protein n=1 Tax=Mycobacterium canetti TaxID=78331 RepID=UPI0013147DFA|nr:hypothetical protein [Mycobacterium canetti]